MNFYITIETPFGWLGLVYQKNPFQIIKTILPYTDRQKLLAEIGKNTPDTPPLDPHAENIVNRIENFFHGIPITPPWERMRMEHLTRLQQAVLRETADIPYGRQKSYKEIAVMIGRPRAYRFVGTTLADNPFPLLVPCHRVIKSDGSYGRFGGGSEMKKKLIELEITHATFAA